MYSARDGHLGVHSAWCIAGLIAPLAGLGGDRTAVPMTVIIIVLTAGSLTAMVASRTTPSPRA